MVDSGESGISFANTIEESDSLNILINEYIYNGGGVAIADFNNDGLEDLFFTGNKVNNELYLNRGELQFQAVGEAAHVLAEKRWCMGVATVDINQDGWMDIYLAVTGKGAKEIRKNILLVNQGLNDEGIPFFKDEAETYRLNHAGYSINSYFFDYDRDGDLDVYVINNHFTNRGDVLSKRKLRKNLIEQNINRLFRNDVGIFTDVTEEAGVLNDGFSLSAVVLDANQDGWQDLFVSNDFVTSSALYINQQDGTFEEAIDQYFQHQSFSSMGVDVVDVDNNLEEDVMTLDMLPQSPQRIKQMLSKSNFLFYDLLDHYKESPQYMRNCFYTAENGRYHEISQFSGIHATDWSWSPIFADFDNDGHKDLSITNGFPRDLTDLDFINYRDSYASIMDTQKDYLDKIPRIKISNIFFKNEGRHQFEEVTFEWGGDQPSYSNGQAVADLDQDGDLELVVSNINDKAFIYNNNTQEQQTKHYIAFKLLGPKGNIGALHAKVTIYHEEESQQLRLNPYRGYLSSLSRKLHFGLGDRQVVDSVKVEWEQGKTTTVHQPKINSTHTISFDELKWTKKQKRETYVPLLQRSNAAMKVDFLHKENKSYDFFEYELHQRVFTNEGPALVVGDLNIDGIEDFIIGGAKGQAAEIYFGQHEGGFRKDSLRFNPEKEVTAFSLFDLDKDGDVDLYVGFGHNGLKMTSMLQDEIYINDGQGNFEKSPFDLPKMETVTAKVIPYDFDLDGDTDLFIASRVIPDKYPLVPQSFYLENRDGSLVDQSYAFLPKNGYLGRIAAAVLLPKKQTKTHSILFTGDWQGIQALVYRDGKFKLIENVVGQHLNGLWNSLEVNDLDGDGDLDIIAGNYGYNTPYHASSKRPFKLFYSDLNGNKRPDPLLFNFHAGAYYPIHLRTNFLNQLQHKKRTFNRYAHYGAATFDEIYTKREKQQLEELNVHHFGSTIFEQTDHGYIAHELPSAFQFSPIFATKALTVDEKILLLVVGNDNQHEVFTGPKNGFIGEVLEITKDFKFIRLLPAHSGLFVPGSAKQIHTINSGKSIYLLIPQNNDTLQMYRVNKHY